MSIDVSLRGSPNHAAALELGCLWNCMAMYKQTREIDDSDHNNTAERAAAAKLILTQRRHVRMQHWRHTAYHLSRNQSNATRHLRELLARRRHIQCSMDSAKGVHLMEIIRHICSLDEEIAALAAYANPK
jgi:hypothetical protein